MDEIEKLIENEEFGQAQAALNKIKDKNAHWHFLQGKIYLSKTWYSEARKQFKIAVKKGVAEKSEKVDEYRAVLRDLEEFSKTPEYKQHETQRFAADCCEAFCRSC